MKSKMKSAFAIIAVALMVMVAVVPMIGVFTSESDATVTTTTDPVLYDDTPATAFDDRITVNATVYGCANNVNIKVTWGSNGIYSQTVTTTNYSSNKATAVIILNDTKASDAKVMIVDGDGVVDPSYKVVSLGALTSGNAYEADLINTDRAAINLTIKMANSTDMLVGSMFPTAKKIVANYKLYDGNGTDKKEIPSTYNSGVLTKGTNTVFSILTVYAPVANNTVYIQVNSIVVDGTTYSMTSELECIVGSSPLSPVTSFKLDHYGATLRAYASSAYLNVPNGTISSVAGQNSAETPVAITDVKIIDTTFGVNDNAYVLYKTVEATKMWATITFGTYSETFTAETGWSVSASGEVNFAPAAGYWGTYTMGSVKAVKEQTSLAIKCSDGTTDTPLSVYVADGCYYAKFPTLTATQTSLKFTAAFDVISFGTTTVTNNACTIAALTAGANDIALDPTKGALVSGTLVDAPFLFSFNVTGFTKIFGATVSGLNATVTSAASTTNSYSFYVAINDKITFVAPTGVTFKTQFVGPFIVPTAGLTNNIALVDKTLSFAFTDQDGKDVSAGTSAASCIVVKYLIPGATTYSTTEYATSGTAAIYKDNTITVPLHDGTVNVANVKVYFTNTGVNNSFSAYDKDTAVAYTTTNDVMSVVTLDKQFKLYVNDSTGAIYTTSLIGANAALSLMLYSAFIAEGTEGGEQIVVYTKDTEKQFIRDGLSFNEAGHYYTFAANKNFVNVTLGTIAKYVLALDVDKTKTELILDDKYLVSVDNDGIMYVVADADYITGYIYRSNEETPISGVTVNFYSSKTTFDDTTLVDTAVSDADGEFTVSSASVIGVNYSFKFSKTGYEFKSGSNEYYAAYDATDGKITEYAASKDLYTISMVDADGALYKMPAYSYIIGLEADPIAIGTEAVKTKDIMSKFIAGQVVNIKLMDAATNGNAYRTFAQKTITEEEIASGILVLDTQESTYKIAVVDSEGTPISEGTPKVYYYENGVTTDMTGVHIGKVTLKTGTIGVYTVPLTELGSKSGEYVVMMTDGANYSFEEDALFPFEDNEVMIESLYTLIVFSLTDAAGNVIVLENVPGTYTGTAITAMKVQDSKLKYDARTVALDKSNNTLFFYGSEDLTYYNAAYAKVILGSTTLSDSGYTISKKSLIVDGVMATDEAKIAFVAVDPSGIAISGQYAKVTAYAGAVGTTWTLGALSDTGIVTKIFDADLYDTYALALFTDDQYTVASPFTFANSDDFLFVAEQAYVKPTFVTANGVDLTSSIVAGKTVTPYALDGTVAGVAVTTTAGAVGAMIVDPDAAYYVVQDGVVAGYTFDESIVPTFIANESIIAGTVPYTGGAAAGSVRLDLYLEDDLVKSVAGTISADKYNYTAVLDLSDFVVDGVAFDSIIAVYSEGGVVIAAAAVDPFTQVNDIVSPIAQQFEVELVAPSAIVALHVDYAQVGNTATVTADGKFIVADDESIYTDGQYIYTFAGWYVDNELVSPNPVFTFTMTESVVISPQYTVTYEKTSDVNKDVEKEYVNIVEKVEVPVEKTVGIDTNVLIIGICAVIVALIAVVYAVIKKD